MKLLGNFQLYDGKQFIKTKLWRLKQLLGNKDEYHNCKTYKDYKRVYYTITKENK